MPAPRGGAVAHAAVLRELAGARRRAVLLTRVRRRSDVNRADDRSLGETMLRAGRHRDLISLIEAVYDLKAAPGAWIAELARRAHVVVPTSGVAAYAYDEDSDARLRVSENATANLPPALGGFDLQRFVDELKPPLPHLFHPRTALCDTASGRVERAGLDPRSELVRLRERGIVESLGVVGGNADGRGVVISLAFASDTSLGAGQRAYWSRVASHLAASLRLRRRLWTDETIEAGSGAAPLAWARRQVQRPGRSLPDRDREDRSELWEGLVSGRWSLLQHFEADSLRALVALENDAALTDPRALTARQRDVLELAARGHDNITIAIQLGLEPTTVGTHLAEGLARLGIRHRAALIVLYHCLAGD